MNSQFRIETLQSAPLIGVPTRLRVEIPSKASTPKGHSWKDDGSYGYFESSISEQLCELSQHWGLSELDVKLIRKAKKYAK